MERVFSRLVGLREFLEVTSLVGGAASSYLVQPTSTGLLDGNSLKKASRDGYTCCVPGCYSNTKKNRELSFYKFPREKVTRDKWINAIKRKAFIPIDHHLVCSQHFKGGKKVAHVIFLQYFHCFSIQKHERNLNYVKPSLLHQKECERSL